MRGIYLIVCFATPCKMTVVFQFMWAVTFDTLYPLNPAQKGSVAPFPTVFTLEHSWVHIYFFNSGDIVSYIEILVNKAFCLATTLNIPNIQLNNGHIWPRGYLNDMWFRYEHDIVKNLVLFDNVFDDFRSNRTCWIFLVVWDVYDF